MSKYITCLKNMTKYIYSYNKINPLSGKSSLFRLNVLLQDYYEFNNMDWFKYLDSNVMTYNKTELYKIDNVEISMINLPKGVNHYNTNSGNSALLLLNGEITKYYINNEIIIPNDLKNGGISNIYDDETYCLKGRENSLLLNITLQEKW